MVVAVVALHKREKFFFYMALVKFIGTVTIIVEKDATYVWGILSPGRARGPDGQRTKEGLGSAR